MKWIKLSYNMNENMPLYPDTPKTKISPLKDMSKGDSCYTYSVTFCNHSGTHVDAPGHFWEKGKRLENYSINDFHFKKPQIIECPKTEASIIEPDDIKDFKNQSCDLLLIRTGFQQYRKSDPEKYSYKNPCISPETAKYLREKFPNLRAIGLDSISVASRSNRHLGKETHQILLDENNFNGPALLLIEDMFLPDETLNIKEAILNPFIIEGTDSAPCAVLGGIDD